VSLARQEGWSLFSGAEAVLKGVLECDTAIRVIAVPWGETFSALGRLSRDDAVARLLRGHGTSVVMTPGAVRAVTLAAHAAASGHISFALVPNEQLDLAMSAISRADRSSFASGGAICLLLEDDPLRCPASCPRAAAMRLDLPCLEPGDVAWLRDSVEHAVRLCRGGGGLVALVVHGSILRSAETMEARPNRVIDAVDALPVGPRRRPSRWAETGGVVRVARRLELNRTTSVPSPGERLPVGFIVVGPASTSISHLIYKSRLSGRVPVLRLGLLNPIDEAVVQRMLGRCEQVVVLEPRPGVTESSVLGVAEALRRRGEHAALVYGRTLTSDTAGDQQTMKPDDAVHPSILGRKIVDLLHTIRPGLDVTPLLAPDPPALAFRPPPRGDDLGSSGALALVHQVLVDVDQRLRDQAPGEGEFVSEGVSTALAIDGVEPAGVAGRVVHVETWPYRRFLSEGIASLWQAAWDDRPWMFVICAVGSDDPQDVERLVRGSVPGERADGVRIEMADLNDRGSLRDLLHGLTAARLSAVIACDGPPPRFDVASLERLRAEIDALGFEPRQRMVRPVEEACYIRHPQGPPRPLPLDRGSASLQTRFSAGRSTRRLSNQLRFRIRPLFEQVEVVRDRPPASTWRDASSARLALPQPIHASASEWRVHLAGFRGAAPGVVAHVLGEAGRAMGYQVRTIHDPTPIGPGRRAWAQVLFTRPRRDQSPLPITATIPYGEADLLLGLEFRETLRALEPGGSLRVASPHRTCGVVNLGALGDELASPSVDVGREVAAALHAVTREDVRLTADFARACGSAFHTDRVVDLALVGAAFQLGSIPVSREAIERAVERVEVQGMGRAVEAFQFGRHLAVDDRLFARPGDRREEDILHMVRRARLLLTRERAGGRLDAGRLAGLLERTLAEMPGLSETDPGRHARRDFVIALQRCLAWGGFDYARRYADLIVALYRADRGDKGRAITRDAILPLADVMLIRDPIYVATIATSADQRLRTRRRLNVKLARGDRIERRYLTRIELVAFHRRFRLDVRSSDWPAWVVAVARHRIPQRWRGSARERQMRAYVIDVTERTVRGAAHDYERWSETMRRLHQQAREDRLRGMALSELRMLVEAEEEGTKGLRD
jgi:Pyruvate/2-oxoacid:ferredoxin oxidoreductase gamma subunit